MSTQRENKDYFYNTLKSWYPWHININKPSRTQSCHTRAARSGTIFVLHLPLDAHRTETKQDRKITVLSHTRSAVRDYFCAPPPSSCTQDRNKTGPEDDSVVKHAVRGQGLFLFSTSLYLYSRLSYFIQFYKRLLFHIFKA